MTGDLEHTQAILAALARESADQNADGAWARKTLDTLRGMSPTSVKVRTRERACDRTCIAPRGETRLFLSTPLS